MFEMQEQAIANLLMAVNVYAPPHGLAVDSPLLVVA
jgi:hypothetical protein